MKYGGMRKMVNTTPGTQGAKPRMWGTRQDRPPGLLNNFTARKIRGKQNLENEKDLRKQ